MKKIYYLYILTNFTNTVFYIGVTNDLKSRVAQHKQGTVDSFTKRYKVHKLVYAEEYPNINEAIRREKQLKNWHRQWKINLIKESNSNMLEIAL